MTIRASFVEKTVPIGTVYWRSAGLTSQTESTKTHISDDIAFQTKPLSALSSIDQALRNGMRVATWSFNESEVDPSLDELRVYV